MRSPLFEKLIDIVVLQKEGYWTDDPNDDGQLTIWGVSSSNFPADVAKMKVMSEADALEYAKDFYWNNFWLPMNADNYDELLALVLLDGAINQGVEVMVEWIGGLGNQITADKILCWRLCQYVKTIENKPKDKEYAWPWMQRMAEVYQWHG
jgi:lysozyme family protein